MNPQYIQQQQQQPFGAPPQNYPPTRASPALANSQPGSGFQNVPLGPPKINQMPSIPSTQNPPLVNLPIKLGQSHQEEQFQPNMRQQMPHPQGSIIPPPNQFGPSPPTSNQPPNVQNGPLQPTYNGQNLPPLLNQANKAENFPPQLGPNQPRPGQNPLPISKPGQNLPRFPPTFNQKPQNIPHNPLAPPPLSGPPPLSMNSQPLQGHPPPPLSNSQPLPNSQPLQGHPPHLANSQSLQSHPPPPLSNSQPLQGHPPPFSNNSQSLPGVPGHPQPLLTNSQSLHNRPPSLQSNLPSSQSFPGQPPLQSGFPGQSIAQLQHGAPNVPSPGPNRFPAGQFNQPPVPGQPPQGHMNQLNSQMQGMNLSGPRMYPGAPIPSAMNGDNGPHMPPPMSQHVNGQQMRGPPGSGFPPMPNQPALGGPGVYPQPQYQQPQQNKKLDPDQMPNPIQVTEDDRKNRSGVFCTNQKGLVPPLVTTNFVVNDQGNCSPRFVRSTMYNVPITQDIMKQTALPFSLSISPMARTVENEYPPPIVNFGDLGPVRCIRCKAYMCPFMQFIDSGRRFQCMFCKATTDVPAEYFQHLDHTGQRMDRFERPELVLGTYEFVATTDYCRNNVLPKPPAIIFVIDVSYNSVKSGLVNLLCAEMKNIIANLPGDGQEKSNTRIGFITYNSSVHFYNIKGTLAAPQMLLVGDTQEMFMPLLDGFLSTPEESAAIIDSLMQQIPTMFGDTRETETILLPAILAGLEALKASECAGKLLVFHSTLPTAEAPGKLKNRDDRKLLGTDKERTVLTPQIQAYNQLGQDCVASGCSVDLFIFNNAYIDIATIGQVSRLTGGEVFKYTYFQADIDGERLINDIVTDISRPTAFDAIMRVRTSTGVRPTDFYGHFFMSNTTDIELAAIDCDKAVAVEIKHDDKLSEEDGVYIQAALLYTSCSGQRRLRIMNLSLKTCSQMADLYRCCDSDTVINYIAKQAVYKLLDNNPKAVKDNIVNRTAQILASYRKNCASPSSAGQLILPECMKLLPLYVNCLLKSDALAGGSDMTIDDRSFVMQAAMIMDITTSVNYYYPRLIPIHDIDLSKEKEVPSSIRCTIDKMNEQGVYILENGIHMFLWIGLGANPEFIQKVFGTPSAIQVDIEKIELPKLDNPLSAAVRFIIDEIRFQRHRCMRLTLVRQREKLEHVFKHFLVEDRGTDGSPSYVDFLIHMHKEIRSLLS